MTFADKLKLLMAGATAEPWLLGEYEEHLGYDCMTGGVRVGPLVLDGSDYGQRHCEPISAEGLARILADAKLIAEMRNHATAISALVEAGEKLKTHLEQGWDESDEPKDVAAADSACNEFIAALNALNKES